MDALIFSGIPDKIIVSTDSQEIIDTCNKYGSGVKVWKRPKDLATDNAHVMDTMQLHVKMLDSLGEKYDYVIMHHATAPLCEDRDIRTAFKTMVRNDADFIISMCKSPLSLNIAKPVPEDKWVKGWFPKEYRGLNRQELPVRYELDNNIYMGKWDIFLNNIDYWETNIMMFEMPLDKRADIDTEEDFIWAERQFVNNRTKSESKAISDFVSRISERAWGMIMRSKRYD